MQSITNIKSKNQDKADSSRKSERRIQRHSSLISALDQETIKAISTPRAVLLYHSKWGNSSFYYGKIQIPESTFDTLI